MPLRAQNCSRDSIYTEFSTYLGGSGLEGFGTLVLGPDGCSYVFGVSRSDDFPTTPGALQENKTTTGARVLTKYDSLGNVIYSTFLENLNTADAENLIKVGEDGCVYIAGRTIDNGLPTQNALQSSNAGLSDLYLIKLDAMGNRVYSTYLGGSSGEFIEEIEVSSDGCLYIAGSTASSDFPTLNPAQPSLIGTRDRTLTKLDANGQLVYSTYWGGVILYRIICLN